MLFVLATASPLILIARREWAKLPVFHDASRQSCLFSTKLLGKVACFPRCWFSKLPFSRLLLAQRQQRDSGPQLEHSALDWASNSPPRCVVLEICWMRCFMHSVLIDSSRRKEYPSVRPLPACPQLSPIPSPSRSQRSIHELVVMATSTGARTNGRPRRT
eukprot:2155544-Pleurochrysis_carterae.AAC.1